MAKSKQPGFIELHVEKVVMAVALLLLVAAIVTWGTDTPRTVEVVSNAMGSAEEVKPAAADQALLSAAEQIEQRHQKAQPEPSEARPWLRVFDRLASVPFPPALGDLTYIAAGNIPDVEIDIEPPDPISASQLAAVIPAPTTPKVWIGQELRRLAEGDLADENVAHGAADLDWAGMAGQWQTLLRPRGLSGRPVAMAMEVQRQKLGSDGKWGEPERVTIARAPNAEGQTLQVPPLPSFTGKNADAVKETVGLLETNYQSAILQPDYWAIWWGPTSQWADWRIHLPKTEVAAAYAEQGNAVETRVEDGRSPRVEPRPIEEDRGEDRRPSDRLERLRRLEAEERGPRGGGGPYEGEDRRRPAPVRRPEPEDRRPPVRRDDQPARAVGAAVPGATATPPINALVDGKIMTWFHDVGLETRGTYRYRLRIVFVNPLYGKNAEGVVKNPADLKQTSLNSPWSEWSQPRRVPHPTEFFVTGHNPTAGSVQVTVFTRTMGRYIRQTFTVDEGQTIGDKARATVLVPSAQGNEVTRERRMVDFSTAATALEFDFERVVPSWGATTTTTVAVIYLDENGNIQTRTREADVASERLKELKALAP